MAAAWTVNRPAWAAAAIALALTACIGGESGGRRAFLSSCGQADDCGSDQCIAGICTRSCTVASDCGAGVCVQKLCKALESVQCAAGKDCTDLLTGTQCRAADCTVGKCASKSVADGAPCGSDKCAAPQSCQAGTCATTAEAKAPVCDDANPCTADGCTPTSGCTTTPNLAACDDGDACTAGDVCGGGACAPGKPIDCDDKNLCTTDSCAKVGGCAHAPKVAGCDDGDSCTTADECVAGACKGTPKVCKDSNPCTADSCTQAAGCVFLPADGTPCSDANLCFSAEVCKDKACSAGGIDLCNDGNACTLGTCANDTCNQQPVTAACSDGDACTIGEACKGLVCAIGVPADCDDGSSCTVDTCTPKVGCTHTAATDGAGCDDDTCTTGKVCKSGACSGGNAKVCNDGNPCTNEDCAPTVGCVVQKASDGAACDDGDACTGPDGCITGSCKGGSIGSCDDGSACTTDLCDKQLGCTHKPKVGPCNDGNACTSGDSCATGTCKGAVIPCSADGLCSTFACNPAVGCVKTDQAGPCDDANVCTEGDQCASGACAPGKPKNCDDGKPCTTDACDKVKGCVWANVADGTGCGSIDSCTGQGTCKAGACVSGAPLNCDDKNPCTTDACKSPGGCQYTPINSGVCDDGNACSTGDACGNGACVGPGALACDDGNPCTKNTCLNPTGCAYAPLVDGTACNDGNSCTSNDNCTAAACKGTGKDCSDGIVCTLDTCSGNVCFNVNANSGAPCDDGSVCTTGEKCDGKGSCVGTTVNCNDNNACTNDSCVKALGCQHSNNTIACNDGTACTQSDTCSGGACKGTPVVCGGGPCLTASCTALAGCQTTKLNGTACDDGSACTAGDICVTGVCKAGGPVACSDANPCTSDICQPATGCTFSNITGVCDDGNVCTNKDGCVLGQCTGVLQTCDDGNACTTDSCDPKSGCKNTVVVSQPCSDNSKCTSNDACDAKGACKGTTVNCDDGNACTTDSCSASSGCLKTNVATGAACDDQQLCSDASSCQAGVCTGQKLRLFDTTKSLGPIDDIHDVIATASGYLAVGRTNPNGDDDGLIVAFDAYGAGSIPNKLGTANTNESLRRLTTGPSGNYLAIGTAGALGAQAKVFAVQLDAAGAVKAQWQIGSGVMGVDAVQHAAGWYVVGTTTAVNPDCWVANLSTAGTVSKQVTLTTTGTQACYDVALTSKGRIAVVGSSTETGSQGGRLWELDSTLQSTGALTFVPVETNAVWNTVFPQTDGSWLFGGQYTTTVGLQAGWLMRMASDGEVLQNVAIGVPGANTSVSKWLQMSDGALRGAGTTDKVGGTDPDGVLLFAGPGLTGHQAIVLTKASGNLRTVAVDANGYLLYAGTTAVSGGADAWLLRTTGWNQPTCSAAGLCAAGTYNGCSDGNPCTIDGCAPATGDCTQAKAKTFDICGAMQVCTPTGKCVVGGRVSLPGATASIGCTGALCPDDAVSHTVTLSAYSLDKFPATVDAYAQCVKIGACQDPVQTNTNGNAYNFNAVGRSRHPVNGITWAQAEAYCKWWGGRLPTEHEWERAARGGCEIWKTTCSLLTPAYPWGSLPGTCTEANHNALLSGKGCGTGLTDAVDARPKGKSPYAVYAMKGDVFTWLADWYDSGYYDSAPGTNPQGPASSPSGEKSMRGLGWSDAMEPAWTRWKYDPKAVSSTIGVRCAY